MRTAEWRNDRVVALGQLGCFRKREDQGLAGFCVELEQLTRRAHVTHGRGDVGCGVPDKRAATNATAVYQRWYVRTAVRPKQLHSDLEAELVNKAIETPSFLGGSTREHSSRETVA